MQKLSRDLLKYIGSYLNARDLMLICETAKSVQPMVDWKECAKHAIPALETIQNALQYWKCPDSIRKRWCLLLYVVKREEIEYTDDGRCCVCLRLHAHLLVHRVRSHLYLPVCPDCHPDSEEDPPVNTVWIWRDNDVRSPPRPNLPYLRNDNNLSLLLVDDLFDALDSR
jgi:hypothetical protein